MPGTEKTKAYFLEGWEALKEGPLCKRVNDYGASVFLSSRNGIHHLHAKLAYLLRYVRKYNHEGKHFP
jgi:hypothetical protein